MLNHAVIGTGSRGLGHVRNFDSTKNCRVIAVCDVDPERLEKAAGIPAASSRVRKYSDYRKLLENVQVDSVSIATCDHWHAPIALAAILAGKHVYIEKPCSHNIHEANLLVKAAVEYKRCVQHGTQRRSSAEDAAAVRAIRDGLIGEVYLAKAVNHQRRQPIGRARPEAPPPGVDYDMWLGPAPEHPFTRNRWHYNWHWFWDYGGGDLVNDGIHQLDGAVWGLGLDRNYPSAIISSGGQLWYDDDHQTPDTQNITYEFARDTGPTKMIIYEMRLWTPYKLEGHDNGTVFYGTQGTVHVGRGKPKAHLDDRQVEINPGQYGIELEGIIPNFIRACLEDDPSRLNSPIQVGAFSTILCHLGNIGTRCGGGRISYEPKKERISGEGEGLANQLIRGKYRQGYELIYG
jgi:predicted dehydrogenase